MKAGTFKSNTCGNVSVLFALCATVLIGASGIAMDTVRTQNEKASLNAAADAAALAAAAYLTDNVDADKAKLKAKAQAEALQIWNANLSDTEKASAGQPVITVGDDLSVTVTYNGKVPTTLSKLLGFADMPVTGKSVASGGAGTSHWDFSFAIDTSSSMGIGATQADMDAMLANPKMHSDPSSSTGCMFACHYSTSGNDTLAVARKAGYKLRLDVVDDAVDKTIDIIAARPSIKAKAALYGMAKDIEVLKPMSANLKGVKSHEIQIALSTASVGNTNFRKSMESLTDKVGKSGDGSKASKPRKVAFIVTDGIHDTDVWEPNVVHEVGKIHQLGPIGPSYCAKLKADDVIVGVLYINYITPAGFGIYVDPYKDQVLPALKACASDGYFHNANSAEEIENAMQQIVAKAFTSDVRLTQ